MEENQIISVKLKRKYIKSQDFKKYYVTGAIGGFRNPYDFRLSFYDVDTNEFVVKAENLKVEKGFSKLEMKNYLDKMEMPHMLTCELVMSKKTVIELFNFIRKELKLSGVLDKVTCPECNAPIKWVLDKERNMKLGKCTECGLKLIKEVKKSLEM